VPPRAAGWYVAEPDRDRFGKEHCMSEEQGDSLQAGGQAGGADQARAPAPTPRNKGQSLVEAFRQARVKQRPALRTDLRDGRAALHQARLLRLGRGGRPNASPPAEPACPAVQTAVADAAQPEQKPETQDSIFATLCVEPKVLQAAPQIEQAAVGAADVAPPPAPAGAGITTAETALPLSTIGFGPGMTIRLGQLGIETVSQLAAADPGWLRTSLGDLSQLVHAELWIATARKACADQA